MKLTHNKVYDEIRKQWVAATPEELVRQALVQKMIKELGFPAELLSIEKELGELPHLCGAPSRRVDLICFAKGIHPSYPLYPLLLVECKERGLTQAAQEQVIGYNHWVKAPFIALAAQEGVCCGYCDQSIGKYRFISFLPSYSQLISKSCDFLIN